VTASVLPKMVYSHPDVVSVIIITYYVGVAVGISSLSCIKAEKFVIAYVLPAMVAIFDLLVTLTSQSIRISSSVLRDPENVGIAVRISSLSCIQAYIFVIAYLLPGMAAIFDFPGHSYIEEYSL